jgi:septum formation protein
VNHRPHLLLASNSPRRRQLLALGNWSFSVSASEVDEGQVDGEDPGDYVLRLAEAKASAVTAFARPDQIVIGADTTVVDRDEILGKPKDPIEAADMLRRLRGHSHQVYTGIAALAPGIPAIRGAGSVQHSVTDRKSVIELCITDVPMRSYTDEEIDTYILTGDALDKAGAYGIQHAGFDPVEGMQGCYASVMGLPLCHLIRLLRKLDVLVDLQVAANCQDLLHYDCPVSDVILKGWSVDD